MFAVLHIADFALHAVLRTESHAANKPAALFSGTGKKSVVLATNPAARTAGVEFGMTAPQAVARCPALTIRAPDAAAETEARAALLAVAFMLSPAIEDTAPGVCTLDVKGVDPAKLISVAETAVTELTRLGLPATAGLAATPLLALYAARSANNRSHSLNLSRSSPPKSKRTRNEHEERSDRSDPKLAESPAPYSTASATPPLGIRPSAIGNSSALLHIADASAFLAPLPLAAADPPPGLASVLAAWGLRTLGDLTALPREEIVLRFGAEGLALWQRASGGDSRPLHLVAPPREFSAAMEFEHEVETLEPLIFILRRFLDRLALELRAAQLVAAELELTLRLEDETHHIHRFRLPEPTADVEILFRALHTYLEPLRTAAGIAAVQLRLTPARPLVRQQGLFETGLRDPHGFAETLARLSALVGPDRVGTPRTEDTHRPDAVKLVPPPAVIPPSAEPLLHPPFGLPLRRFRPPLPARLEFTGGRPTFIWTERMHGEISQHSSPYPTSGDWWQNDRRWQRTEWDIALAGGGLYRLLLIDNTYFLEGEYD